MADPQGFLKYNRQKVQKRPIDERVKDFKQLNLALSPKDIYQQSARCMDCGIPFCHGAGCPLGNRIPEFNELVYNGKWQQACENLHTTNNFPEITGRICPAPCETACTLGINDEPVMIRQIEYTIVEEGFKNGWIKPLAPKQKSGKRVAIIGSGPSGLAAAQQLARLGHSVTVFEKDEKPGGLLRYGIPDFKLEKHVIDRRLNQLIEEGVDFQTGLEVGTDISANYLKKMFDAVCLTMGAGHPRDLNVTGRGYENIHFAMEYLKLQNKIIAAESIPSDQMISAKDKHVIVIGGGDTGSDCVGTARRQGAKSIHQLEILPQPPESRPPDTPWPMWPRIMRTSSSHEEGCTRKWSVTTKKFSGAGTRVTNLHACHVEWFQKNGQWKLKEVPGSDFNLKADLVLLAMGFVHVQHNGLIQSMGLKFDPKGNILVQQNSCQTSLPYVFAAGDTVSGASLVVRAIDNGRKAAKDIDNWLKKET